MGFLADIIGVLGFLLAAISLGWQVRSQRVQLRVEIDEAASDFAHSKMLPTRSPRSPPLPEACTVVRIALTIANASRRPNTVTRIEMVKPAARDLISAGASVDLSPPWEGPAHWEHRPEWAAPHPLAPGDQHEAWMYFVLTDRAWGQSEPMNITVRVSDSYKRSYIRKAELRHCREDP